MEVFDQVDKGSASVTIYILDVNDNPPEISDYEFNDFFENNTDVVGVIKNVSRHAEKIFLSFCVSDIEL